MSTVSVVRVSSVTNAQECVAREAVSKAPGKEVTKFSAQHSFRGLQQPINNPPKGQKIQTSFIKVQAMFALCKRKCMMQVRGDPTLCFSVWQK